MQTMIPVGPAPSKIMIVAECPNLEDFKKRIPLANYSGQEFGRMLGEAGLSRANCFISHVVKYTLPKNTIDCLIAHKKKEQTPKHVPLNNKMVLPQLVEQIELLKRDIEICRPNVIIALGNGPLWALTGEWGVTKWRASNMRCILDVGLPYTPKVIPIISPSMIQKQWSWRTITVNDLRRIKRESEYPEIKSLNYEFLIRPNYSQVLSTLDILQKTVEQGDFRLSVDLETRVGHIDCCGIAWNSTQAICIPMMHTAEGKSYWSLEEELEIVGRLKKLLTHKNCRVIGQNFHYDAQYTWRWWLFVPHLWQDTMVSQHTCFANLPKSLGFLSSMYSQYHEYWKDEGKEYNNKIQEDERWSYCCKDCCRTFEVSEVLLQTIKLMGLEKVHQFQQDLWWPILETMNRGIKPNLAKKASFGKLLEAEIAKREQYYIDMLGFPLNPKSPPQMQDLFYRQFAQRKVYKRGAKGPSCDDEALIKISEREPILKPLCNNIREHRSLAVFLSTFVNSRLDIDGRIRCLFKETGTETYRFASTKNAFGSGMNLQNIPKGGEEDSGLTLPNVRTMFIPDNGMEFFDIDLSAADLRIVVWESDEPEMKQMLREGLDPYTEVAKEFYHDPSITKKDKRRQLFKSFCHGTNYLGTAKGLAGRLGLAVHESEKTQSWYFSRFPRIKKWQETLIDNVYKRRMVSNVFGYRCYFFDRIEGTIFNQAAAWIPQSTVACIINRAYLNIYRNLREVQVLLQVHDSLAGQFPADRRDYFKEAIIKECSVELPFPGDPLIIPVDIKTSRASWGECG